MLITKSDRYLYESLTRYNFFPNQKQGASEVPPTISSRQFTPEIAEKIAATKARQGGYGVAEYRATRYNNVPRLLSFIHPKACADLSKIYHDNFEQLGFVYENKNSAIRPSEHMDGRLFVMNYESQEEKSEGLLGLSFGKKFRVHTDIVNCFGSIYTHSIEWATRGFRESKNQLALKPQHREANWGAELDKKLRNAKRNETQGIPIGPATSSLAVEIILGKIDEKLAVKYDYVRYIDDYTCLCDTHEKAEEFLHDLSNELEHYKLKINLAKTTIIPEPEPAQEDWITEILLRAPKPREEEKIKSSELSPYINYLVRTNKSTPDGSVLKFGIGKVINFLDDKAQHSLLCNILNLSWHYPVLLPFLEKFDLEEYSEDSKEVIQNSLHQIMAKNIESRRSDGLAWPLHLIIKNNLSLPKMVIEGLLNSDDCITLAMLTKVEDAIPYLKRLYAEKLGLPDDEKDKYWLFLYQLYLLGDLQEPYEDDQTFEIMRSHNVNFIPKETTTEAENYCSYLAYHDLFEEGGEIKPFDEWIKNKR